MSKLFKPLLELLLLGAIAISILLRLVNLGSRELWYDEVLSVLLATGQRSNYQTPPAEPVQLSNYAAVLHLPPEANFQQSIDTAIALLRGLAGDVHPPLSYLSLHFWLRLLGNSEVAMRSLVALLSIGAIFAAYGLGRTILGHRGGLLLSALLGLNPFYLSHSLNLRMYSPLVLWTILSAWAAIELMPTIRPKTKTITVQIGWTLLLIGSVAAGLLTQYLFVYWLMTLGILMLLFDPRRWWLHGLRLGAGVLLFLPWFFWGTRQQIRNRSDVFTQISQEGGVSFLEHLQDVAKTLGTHLVVGEWASSIPVVVPTVAGLLVMVMLAVIAWLLWQRRERQLLGLALVLGILPLLLAVAVDVAGEKLTVGFGWGRSLIFILPGCLLLMVAGIEKTAEKWRQPIAISLLLVYLSVSLADYGWRSRWMFHQIADIIEQKPTTPTLIAMNSQAWGHVLRLAYYLPTTAPVSLLAQKPANLAEALKNSINSSNNSYSRLIWIEYADPVWGVPTAAERQQNQQEVARPIASHYQSIDTKTLTGTMVEDNFTVRIYSAP